MSVSAEVLARAPLETTEGETDTVNSHRPRSNVRPLSPMPDYVEHRNGVNEVGKLSAEAVVREYEAAVKEIEALGSELQLAAKNCEVMVAGVHEMIAEIKEFAAGYRDQGKRFFLQIEAVSLMTTEVRNTCESLKKKIATDTLTR